MLHRHENGEPEHNLPLLASIMQWRKEEKLSGHVGEMAGWILRKGNYSRTEPDVEDLVNGCESSIYEIADKNEKPLTDDYIYKLNIRTNTIRIIQGTQLVGSFCKFDTLGVNRFLAKIGRELPVMETTPTTQEPLPSAVTITTVDLPADLRVTESSTYSLLGGVLESRSQTPVGQSNTQSSPVASGD